MTPTEPSDYQRFASDHPELLAKATAETRLDEELARFRDLIAPFMYRWLNNPNANTMLRTFVEEYYDYGGKRKEEMLEAVSKLEEFWSELEEPPYDLNGPSPLEVLAVRKFGEKVRKLFW